MQKVAAYCRVSTDKEDQANSLESQQRYFMEYIERNPCWELSKVYVDEGITGTSTRKRNAFNRMIADARNNRFDLIVTKEISRFARNTLDSIYYTRKLKEYGIGVLFVNDNINTLDPDAELRLTIMSSIAQEESRKTSERVKWGQKRRMEQGVVFGRDMLGYDLKDGKMHVNEEGARIVRLIFHKYIHEGKGCYTIARELREAGIPTSRGNLKWSNATILKILRNEKYAGDLVQKKTYTPSYLSHEKKYNKGQEDFVVLRDHHEPIISRDLYEKVQLELKHRRPGKEQCARYSNRYCFSGKIKCGYCGATFVPRNRKRRDGTRYRAWRCGEAANFGRPHTDKAGNKVGCDGRQMGNDDLMDIIALVIRSLRINKEALAGNLMGIVRTVLGNDGENDNIEKIARQISRTQEKKQELLELFLNRVIKKPDFTSMNDKLDHELGRLDRELKNNRQLSPMTKNRNRLLRDIAGTINAMAGGDMQDPVFFHQILDRIVIHDRDTIDIYLNALPYRWRCTLSNVSGS